MVTHWRFHDPPDALFAIRANGRAAWALDCLNDAVSRHLFAAHRINLWFRAWVPAILGFWASSLGFCVSGTQTRVFGFLKLNSYPSLPNPARPSQAWLKTPNKLATRQRAAEPCTKQISVDSKAIVQIECSPEQNVGSRFELLSGDYFCLCPAIMESSSR